MNSDDTLSSLPRGESEEVIRARIQNTRMLHELNHERRLRDPIIRDACELDSLAKSMGLYIEFNEELDPNEDF